MPRPSVEVETAVADGRAPGVAVSYGARPAAESDVASVVASDGAACANCGERLAGDYCHRCGEKRPGARDLSARHFVAEAAQELTSVEHSKLLRTAAALLFRPGRLTAEYFAGRRSRYLKPLNLCLGVFALTLFVYSSSNQVSIFNFGQLVEQERGLIAARGMEQKPVYERLVERIAERRRLSREAAVELINERWGRNFSLFQVPEIALFSLLLAAVYFFSRRYLVEHVVFSLHFLAFTSLTTVLMWPVYYVVGIRPTMLNMAIAAGKFVLDIVYLFYAQRAFYRERPLKAMLRAPVLFAGYFIIYVVTYIAALAVTLLSLRAG